jgi:hypothetical protein
VVGEHHHRLLALLELQTQAEVVAEVEIMEATQLLAVLVVQVIVALLIGVNYGKTLYIY